MLNIVCFLIMFVGGFGIMLFIVMFKFIFVDSKKIIILFYYVKLNSYWFKDEFE